MSSSSDMMNEYLKNYMRKYFERRLLKEVEPATIASKHEDGSGDTSSAEEQGGDDSDTQSSDDETEVGSFSNEAENRRTLENLKSPIPDPKFDPKSASVDNELESDAYSKRIPSNYTMQPICKGSVSSWKRSRNEIGGDLVRRCQKSRIEEKKSVSTGGVGSNVVDLKEPMGERLGTQAAKWKAKASASQDTKIAAYATLYNFYKLYITETEERVRKDLCKTINKMKKNLGLDSDDDA